MILAVYFLQRPYSWLTSKWRHSWGWPLRRRLFEARHYRHLAALLLLLLAVTAIWSGLVLGLIVLSGSARLVSGPAFAQNVIASLLVLPVGIAVGVVVGTLLEKRSLRFKARHAGDKLADSVRLVLFELVIALQREGGVPVDLDGPTDHRFFRRARSSAIEAFSTSQGAVRLPLEFDERLQQWVRRMAVCFLASKDLRLAFPRAFDSMDRLEGLMASIEQGSSSSTPENTTLIILFHAIEIVNELA